MNTTTISVALAATILLTPLAVARAAKRPPPAPATTERLAAEPFDPADVRLDAGPFRDARDRDLVYLLSLDPDRFLRTFRDNVGLPSAAEPYGGWESPGTELRGHSLGHYLSACSLMYRATGNPELRRRVEHVVRELAACQAAGPAAGFHEGYLSAFPESFLDGVEARTPVWAPWYTIHKIMAGLLDAYRSAGDREALDVLVRMASWVRFRVDRLDHEKMQAVLGTEFGGMSEVLANLYAVTRDEAHLRLAKAFEQDSLFGPLAAGEDRLDGLHANTQIPKAIGAAREFELTGEDRYRRIAETFWERVALHRSYVIGGNSDGETFFPVDQFAKHVGTETAETCNTYNMLKLTRHLFGWKPRADLMDFYERALYNHILASQDPATGGVTYLTSLEPGHFKVFSSPENSFWCCVGTGMENHAKYGDAIYARDGAGIYANLFVPSEVTWRERGARLRQETEFPNEDTTRFVWSCERPVSLALRVRHPEWAEGPMRVTVNGRSVEDTSAPFSYLEIRRTWRDGDRVEVTFPMKLRAEYLPGTTDTVALLYGPIVLAGNLGTADVPGVGAWDQLNLCRYPDPPAPALVTSDDDWLKRVELVSRSPLVFRTRGLARPGDVTLVPFYEVHHERYAVYWSLTSPEAWADREKTVAATEAAWHEALAKGTDAVTVGDLASESAHAGTATKAFSGAVGGRGWRNAVNGGEIDYTLATKGADALTLVCAFGARDRERNFDLFVDDAKVTTPEMASANGPGLIRLVRVAVPKEALAGKQRVTVRFVPAPRWGDQTPNVFGVALVPASDGGARP